jgi:hypothetical protein
MCGYHLLCSLKSSSQPASDAFSHITICLLGFA